MLPVNRWPIAPPRLVPHSAWPLIRPLALH